MWPFSRVPKASPKRVAELEDQLADVEIALAWCKKAIVDLNARMATVTRQVRAAAVEELQEDRAGAAPAEPGNGTAAPRLGPFSTAHLARRFKGG